MAEKRYKDFNKSAKGGISKYCGLSSAGMRAYDKKYKRITGKNPSHINNKEHFYSWVSRNRLRKGRKK